MKSKRENGEKWGFCFCKKLLNTYKHLELKLFGYLWFMHWGWWRRPDCRNCRLQKMTTTNMSHIL